MFYGTYEELIHTIIEIQGHRTCLLSFSTGKDSVAMFLRLYHSGLFDKFVLFYYYLIPDMSWINEYLDYFEKKYDLKIIRVPSPSLYRLLDNGVLQTPERLIGLDKLYMSGFSFKKFDYGDIARAVIHSENLPENTYMAVGVKENDSARRRMAMRKYGLINHNQKKYYPVFDFSNRDINDILDQYEEYLPEDYDLFGLTFDGLDYRFLKPIMDRKPADYEKIKEIFPLIDLMIHKRERYLGTELPRSKYNGYTRILKSG